MDHMLDIHRKCRREREELEGKLAQVRADHERQLLVHTEAYVEVSRRLAKRDELEDRRAVHVAELEGRLAEAYDLPSLGKVVGHMVTIPQQRYDALVAVADAARAYRKASDALGNFDARRDNLADCADAHVAARLAVGAALDALAAAEQSDPRRASGQTSGEDGVCPDCGGEGKVYASDGEDSYYSEPCPNDIAHVPRPLKAWAAFPGPAVSGAGQAGEEVGRG